MSNFDLDDVKNFLNNLDHDKIYILIPFISVNDRSDEPFTILSQQILITRNSTPVLLSNFIDDKTFKAFKLFNPEWSSTEYDISYCTIFKYKVIDIDYKSINNFIDHKTFKAFDLVNANFDNSYYTILNIKLLISIIKVSINFVKNLFILIFSIPLKINLWLLIINFIESSMLS